LSPGDGSGLRVDGNFEWAGSDAAAASQRSLVGVLGRDAGNLGVSQQEDSATAFAVAHHFLGNQTVLAPLVKPHKDHPVDAITFDDNGAVMPPPDKTKDTSPKL
jgi:hypothetical protein